MSRIYYPYWKWEDFNAGMWRNESAEYEISVFPKIVQFTGNYLEYGSAMMEVIESWPLTMEHNLTNPSLNHLAFIGHCACCYKFGWPEYLVRRAWKVLSKEQQDKANEQARKAYKVWHALQNRTLQKNMGAKMLF